MNAIRYRLRKVYQVKRVAGWPLSLSLMLLIPIVLLSCTPTTASPPNTPTDTPAPSATPTATNTPSPSPTPTNTPSPTPTPGPLSSAEVLEIVSPSVAFIELPTQTGSGFLFGEGYIVTNAHVVWPFEKTRVVFPNGEEHKNVPVVNWDMMCDLAVLGPIETELEPVSLTTDEERIVGDEVYLIGYPNEVEDFPQPTIARGLISRLREWEPVEMTYYQVDAKFGYGQSGGVLVTDRAEVAGVANFLFGESGYGLAASSVDVKPHVEQLIASKDDFAKDVRRVPSFEGQKSYDFVDLYNASHVQTFALNEPSGTEIEVEVDGGDNDIAFYVTNAMGENLDWVDENYSDVERYRFTTMVDAPHYINVLQFSPEAHQFSIEANRNLTHYLDFDDHRGALLDAPIDACIDYPGDYDHYLLSLTAGDRVNILVDAIMIDPYLQLGTAGSFIDDDDSGGGVFGLNPELTYIAADSGTYMLGVSDSWGSNIGCYTLYVREPYAGAPKPQTLESPFQTFYSDFGDMWTYESLGGDFSINVPAEWGDSPAAFGDMAALCDMAELCLAGDGLLVISSEDLGILGDMTQEEYVQFYRNFTENFDFGFQIVNEQPFETRTGLQGTVLTFSNSESLIVVRFLYAHEGMGFNVAYVLEPGQQEDLQPLIEYTFSTFAVRE